MSNRLPPEEGIAHYILNLSSILVERGHEIVIVSRGGLAVERTKYNGFDVVKLPFIMAFPFHVDLHGIFVNQFFRDLEGQLDIIHIHTPLPPAVVSRTPIVTTFHTPHFADSLTTNITDTRALLEKILGILSYRTEKSLISSSRVITAVSEGVAMDLERFYGIGRRKIVVLGNAPSPEYLEAGRVASEKETNLILYAGRLEPRKGVLDLVSCMKTVTERVPAAKLVIMGKGPLLSVLVRRVTEFGLQNQIEIRGFVSPQELVNTMVRASVFVLPSYYEGLPTVLLEAMACRAAVVATSVRGTLDVLRDDQTALLVPAKAPMALAAAIVDLLKHREMRQRLGNNARRIVEEQFTWDKIADRTLRAYATARSLRA